MNTDQIVPVLFILLVGIILVNLGANLCLYYVAGIKRAKGLIAYWVSLLITYVLIGNFQTDEISIALSFSLSFIPSYFMGNFFAESLGLTPPRKLYFALWIITTALVPVLLNQGLGFTAATLPMTLAVGMPASYSGIAVFFNKRGERTLLQKFTGVLYLFGSIHLVNFAIFRMVPNTQLEGWGTAICIYQVLSITLFALALEDYTKTENFRLKQLVETRTQELARTLEVKNTLFKIVLHDLANPLTGVKWLVQKIQKDGTISPGSIDRLVRLTDIASNMLHKVRMMESISSGQLHIEPHFVLLKECLNDLRTIFHHQLLEKNIALEVEDSTLAGTMILVDKDTFTTSVLGNLLSNAIKFSQRNSTLRMILSERDKRVVIEIEDQGIGMNEEMTFKLFNPQYRSSRPGTDGELGTGFGMPLVKSCVELFGGSIEIDSRSKEEFPDDHGTRVTLLFETHLMPKPELDSQTQTTLS